MIVTLVPCVSLQTMDELVDAEERTFRIRFFTVPVGRAALERRAGPIRIRQSEKTARSRSRSRSFFRVFSIVIIRFPLEAFVYSGCALYSAAL